MFSEGKVFPFPRTCVIAVLSTVVLGGCSAVIPDYMSDVNVWLGKFAEDNSPKWGYINRFDRLEINLSSSLRGGIKSEPFINGALGPFRNGLARVGVSGDYAEQFVFVDKAGRVVSPRYRAAGHFSEGLAAALLTEAEGFGYVDKLGSWVVQPVFRSAREFREGLAAVQDKGSQLWGFIDRKGKLVIPFSYKKVGDFAEGFASFSKDGRKYGYINKSGRRCIQPLYDVAWNFSEGLAAVEMREETIASEKSLPFKRSYLNSTGRTVFCYHDVSHFLSFPLNRQRDTSEPKHSYEAQLLLKTLPSPLGSINGPEDPSFKEGLAVCRKRGLYGYVNHRGENVIEPMFHFARPFSQHRAVVFGANNNSIVCGAIDREGKLVIPMKYRDIGDFVDGLAWAQEGQLKYGFINVAGIYQIRPEYDGNISSFSEGLAAVGKMPISP